MTAVGIAGAAISGTSAAVITMTGNTTLGLFIGLIIADVTLICQAVAPYLASIGD